MILIDVGKPKEKDGYFEAFTRTWDPIEDMRLEIIERTSRFI